MTLNKPVSAVISVLNEEQTVGDVVKTTLNCRMVDEVIVVNDGSTDNTAKMLEPFLSNPVEKQYVTPSKKGLPRRDESRLAMTEMDFSVRHYIVNKLL